MIDMPRASVMENATIALAIEFSRPLAPVTAVPRAMRRLDIRKRSTFYLKNDTAAPTNTTVAPTPEPTPANIRGSGPKTLDPCANW